MTLEQFNKARLMISEWSARSKDALDKAGELQDYGYLSMWARIEMDRKLLIDAVMKGPSVNNITIIQISDIPDESLNVLMKSLSNHTYHPGPMSADIPSSEGNPPESQ